MLSMASEVLYAVSDIKDLAKAREVLPIVIDHINVQNLVEKMVEIYMYKIGGTPEIRYIHDHTILCKHYAGAAALASKPDSSAPPTAEISHCLKDEYCEYGHLLPRDLTTISTGFNIYIVLQVLEKVLPKHPAIVPFHRDFFKYKLLLVDQELYEKHFFKTVRPPRQTTVSDEKVVGSNLQEQRLLNEIFAKCFPDEFLRYVENVLNHEKERRTDLFV